MHRALARVAITALALVAGCSQRACGHDDDGARRYVPATPTGHARSPALRARCNQEVARGAVAAIPGSGSLDTLVPTCDGETLAVYVMRGHTLTRLTRPLTPGATFSLPDPIATGADRLGAVAPDAVRGPLAWRSPTVMLDDGVGDEWWVAWLDGTGEGGATRVHRGSAVLPTGAAGLGIIAPIARRDAAVEVLTTIARENENPHLVRATVPTGGEELERLTHDPPTLAEGELKAWDGHSRTAVLFAIADDGGAVLRAARIDDDANAPARRLGEVSLGRSHVLVAPTGIALPNGETMFVYSEFDVVRQGAGSCLALDETMCVQPGVLRALRVDANGAVHTSDIVNAGLVDTAAIEHDGTVLVLYVDAIGETRAQHAARFDATSGTVRRVSLTPSDEMPPLDHPTLTRCGNELWLAAEVAIDASDAGRTRETAVMAVPAACLVEGE